MNFPGKAQRVEKDGRRSEKNRKKENGEGDGDGRLQAEHTDLLEGLLVNSSIVKIIPIITIFISSPDNHLGAGPDGGVLVTARRRAGGGGGGPGVGGGVVPASGI